MSAATALRLAAAGAALALLAMIAPGAAASAAETVVLSGTVVATFPDAEAPTPTGAAYRVQVVDESSVVVRQVVTDGAFSLSLPARGSYALRGEVLDRDEWYPSWWNGRPAKPAVIEAEAERFTASRNGLDLRILRTARASGTVTADSATDFVVEAWHSGSTGPTRLATAPVRSDPGRDVAWSFAEPLPVGGYSFRLVETGIPVYSPAFVPDTRETLEDDATLLYLGGLDDVDFSPVPFSSRVERLSGSDRYATAADATRTGFTPHPSPVVYIASGEDWPDALSAGPAAASQRGSLLLTEPDRLPPATVEALEHLQPQRVVVVGSPLSVSDAVLARVDSLTSSPVVRIAGADRYATSRAIVADAFAPGDYETVFLATGTGFADALSVSPIAGARAEPVLLVDGARGAVDARTREAIRRLDPRTARLIGGTPSISADLEADLRASGLARSVERTAGVDRHDTSRLLNDLYPPNTPRGRAYLVSATSFVDALAIGPVAASARSPLYLSEPGCVPDPTLRAMRGQHLDRIVVVGGPTTLAPAVQSLTAC